MPRNRPCRHDPRIGWAAAGLVALTFWAAAGLVALTFWAVVAHFIAKVW